MGQPDRAGEAELLVAGPALTLVRTIAKGLVRAEAATAEKHRVGLFDDIAGFVGHDHATRNLVGAVGQGSDGDVVFAHEPSLSVIAGNAYYKAPFLVR